ncbi:uncharacterized protein LOC103310738 [Acyrthosiphon pisum]|uniref:Uncharacterized protein n=1 Tax=Acyrthosiphon pisum TaxID=7029 RepID=A0A8R2FE50_ACYPI|nr:uncharacterized protein LOC103310738 [Acyrthosiphon pisum]|eukprot:XP_008188204.1 PREDICTED: 5-amino-6-(5-phospho-D-ribitylamino)uracil phosphatase YitU-like [Acyrthosiphon pisum]
MTNQAVFLDMDGTILNEDNRVTNHTNDVIQEVRQKGIKVFIATGRAYDEISYLVPENFEVDGILSSNGAVGYINGKEIFKHQLPMETVRKLVDLAEQHQIYYELFPYYKNRIALKRDKTLLLSEIQTDELGDVERNEWKSRQEALKIKKWEELIVPMKEELDISISHSTTCNLETMPIGVNKATAIQSTLDYLGIAEDTETFAIGDSDNDRQMLEFVDNPIVMKNAPDHIKALGSEVTRRTNVENGVADFLSQKFLIK